MVQLTQWKKVGEKDHYIFETGQKTIHCTWAKDAFPYTSYFLGLSNKSNLPYESRPLINFAQYDVGDINPADKSFVGIRPNQRSMGEELLKYKGFVKFASNIPRKRKKHFIALLDDLERILINNEPLDIC